MRGAMRAVSLLALCSLALGAVVYAEDAATPACSKALATLHKCSTLGALRGCCALAQSYRANGCLCAGCPLGSKGVSAAGLHDLLALRPLLDACAPAGVAREERALFDIQDAADSAMHSMALEALETDTGTAAKATSPLLLASEEDGTDAFAFAFADGAEDAGEEEQEPPILREMAAAAASRAAAVLAAISEQDPSHADPLSTLATESAVAASGLGATANEADDGMEMVMDVAMEVMAAMEREAEEEEEEGADLELLAMPTSLGDLGAYTDSEDGDDAFLDTSAAAAEDQAALAGEGGELLARLVGLDEEAAAAEDAAEEAEEAADWEAAWEQEADGAEEGGDVGASSASARMPVVFSASGEDFPEYDYESAAAEEVSRVVAAARPASAGREQDALSSGYEVRSHAGEDRGVAPQLLSALARDADVPVAATVSHRLSLHVDARDVDEGMAKLSSALGAWVSEVTAEEGSSPAAAAALRWQLRGQLAAAHARIAALRLSAFPRQPCACTGMAMPAMAEGEGASLASALRYRYVAARLALCQFACGHQQLVMASLLVEIAVCFAWLATYLVRRSRGSGGGAGSASRRGAAEPRRAQFVVCAADPEWRKPLLQEDHLV